MACAAPECTEERASYDPLVLCDGPVTPDGLLELAAATRGEGGLVVVGSLRAAPMQTDPRLYPSSCGAGVCLSEARVSARVIVSDALRSSEINRGDELVVTAPATQAPLFTSDERGQPLCDVGEPGDGFTLCYTSLRFLMPGAGDEFVFFLGAPVDGAFGLLWRAQTAGVSVSGAGTFSGQDVGVYELELP